MKKFYNLLLVLVSLLMSTQSYSQTPPYYNQLPTGGTNIFPFNVTTGKGVQWLVAANEFASPTLAPGGHNITQIWFYSNSGSATFTSFMIRLAQIPSVTDPLWSAAGIYTGPMTTVYSQPTQILTSPGPPGWMSITLTTPFLYDPNQALIVEVTQCGSVGGFCASREQ